jgi:RNA recognition motif-containing protein
MLKSQGDGMNIYVGNLSYDTSEEELQKAFSAFGTVASVSMVKDKFTGQSRGFAFVEMPESAEGQAAIDGLNGKELSGRILNINEARPRTDDYGGGGGGGGGRPGGGRGGGGRGRSGGGGGRRY